jgi:hypothetical protein
VCQYLKWTIQGLADISFAGGCAGEWLHTRIESMNIVVWNVFRRLPKPLLLLLSVFQLAARARLTRECGHPAAVS